MCVVSLSQLPLLIAVFSVFILLVLLLLYRSATLLNRRLLSRLLLIAAVAGVAGEVTVLLLRRGPERRPYLAVLPFSPGSASPRAWAVSRSLNENLPDLCPGFYVVSFASVLEAAVIDSCGDKGYVGRFCLRSGLDACVSGEFLERGDAVALQAHLWQRGLWSDTTFLAPGMGLEELSRQVCLWVTRRLGYRQVPLARARWWGPSAAEADILLHKKDYGRTRQVLSGLHTPLAQLLVGSSYLEEARYLRALGRPWREPLYYAVGTLEQLSQQDSSLAAAFLRRAECSIMLEEWDQAEIHLRKTLVLDPTNAHALVLMAHLHRSRYRDLGFEDEEQLYRRAIWYDPLNLTARLVLVNYLKEMARRAEALQAVEQVLHINPSSEAGLVAKGKMLITWEQNEEGMACLEQALRLAPDEPEVLFALGLAHYVANHDDQARAFFERAIAVGDHLDSYLYLGLIARRSGMPERALPYFQERVRRKRDAQDRLAEIARENIFQITH